jgi:hypothetical protein
MPFGNTIIRSLYFHFIIPHLISVFKNIALILNKKS